MMSKDMQTSRSTYSKVSMGRLWQQARGFLDIHHNLPNSNAKDSPWIFWLQDLLKMTVGNIITKIIQFFIENRKTVMA